MILHIIVYADSVYSTDEPKGSNLAQGDKLRLSSLVSLKLRGNQIKVRLTETLTPKPGTRNLQLATRNPEPRTRNPVRGTWNSEPGTRNLEPGTRNPEPETQNSEP